jgi:LysR family transcriptional regulator, transcriptional activator of nhaA
MILLNHHHLYYFWVVAREGSIVRACEKLHLAQPTVSAQIIQLEKALGKKLFDRQKRRLALTEDGRLVLDYADQIFNFSQELLDALKDRPTQEVLRVQLGLVDGISSAVASPFISAALHYPRAVQPTVVRGTLGHLLADLRNHSLDLVFTNRDVPVDETPEFMQREVAELPVHIVAAPHLARRIRRFPQGLSGQPLLLPSRLTPLWGALERFLNGHRLEAKIVGEFQDMDVIRRLTLEGLGVAALNGRVVKEDLQRGKLRRLNRGPTGMTEVLRLVAKKRHRLNPVAEHLLNRFSLKP